MFAKKAVALEKHLILRLGQETHKVSLEYLTVPAKEESAQKTKNQKKPHNDGGKSKGPERPPSDHSWNNSNNKIE